MADDDGRCAQCGANARHQVSDLAFRSWIEIRRRLVEEEKTRFLGDRSGKKDLSLLPA